MAITYRPSFFDKNLQRWVVGDVETIEYVGRVVSVSRRDFRAQSDIYTIATFAWVVEDDGSQKEILVNANYECDVSGGQAKADLDDAGRALLDAYATKMAPIWAEQKRVRDLEAAAVKKKADEAEAYRIANKPVIGTKMIVVRGRKVKVGTTGVVAFISNNTGGVLLKDENVWKDRKANGIWVSPEYLEVYDAKKHTAMMNKVTDKVVKKLTKNAKQIMAGVLGEHHENDRVH